VPQITRVRDDEGACIRALTRARWLEGAPHVMFESQRGQLAGGDPTEGELPRPRSLANGTEPHLANPRKRFDGRVSRPRAYHYRTGHGCPLEPPGNSSTRNPQSATRSMGVVETSSFVPWRDGEGAFKTRRRARPDRLEGAQRAATPPGMHRTRKTSVVRVSLKPAETSPMPVETHTTSLMKFREKTPAGAPMLLPGFGG
jgi:hypothetical protein